MDTYYGTISSEIANKFSRIKLLVCDVDGVFSDGRIYMGDNGEELKAFHARDGYGVKALISAGIGLGVITGRQSNIVTNRMHDLGVKSLVQGCTEKLPEFKKMIREHGIPQSEAAFLGDDMPDVSCMEFAGFAIAVKDAHPSALNMADYVTRYQGGFGAVREVTDCILQCQNKLIAGNLTSA